MGSESVKLLLQVVSNLSAGFPIWKMLHVFSNMPGFTCEDIVEDFAGEEAGGRARDRFVQEAKFLPPDFLRVIDCELSLQKDAVIIVDRPADVGYTAISHTFGMDVYGVFDCGCAADCWARMARADPEKNPCKGHGADKDPSMQQKVIRDVLGMCGHLMKAGVRYAWHDGVCIAQYKKEEVRHFIEHIAWIYANADDTVIFLHYIGCPMAPIAPPSFNNYEPISRWQTRVWTYQEAALSKRRRYCVHTAGHLDDRTSGDNFDDRLASWYEAGDTAILEEPEFFKLVLEMYACVTDAPGGMGMQSMHCILTWLHLLWSFRTSFPTISHALESCSSRESKHEGDRINSILGLAKVQKFSAEKDDRMEEWTMEFFRKMGKMWLTIALFTVNKDKMAQNGRPHTWYPKLSAELMLTPSHFCNGGSPNFHTDQVEFEVRAEDGNLEVRGQLVSVSMHVTLLSETETEAFCAGSGIACRVGSLSAFEIDYFTGGFPGSCVWLAKDCMDSRVLLGSALHPSQLPKFTDKNDVAKTQKYDIAASWEGQFSEHNRPVYAFNLVFSSEAFQLDLATASEEAISAAGVFTSNRAFDVLHQLWTDGRTFPALMVQGDVHSGGAVEKIGCFSATPELLKVLQDHKYQSSVTRLQNLVIQ